MTPEDQFAEFEARVDWLERQFADIQTQIDVLSDWIADVAAGSA